MLQEASYPPVVYFPREDVSMSFLTRTAHATHCPYKGDAAYYTLQMDGHFAENAIWTYEEPYPAMSAIAGRLAFYTNKVEVYAPEDAAAIPACPMAFRCASMVVHTVSIPRRSRAEIDTTGGCQAELAGRSMWRAAI